MPTDLRCEDFTEDAYRDALALAKEHWRFVSYAERRSPGRVCLWRHDIDVSVHRARRLAEIEHERGVHATYFVLLHSAFYNPFEREVCERLRAIVALGHDLALHFDPAFYDARELEGEGLQAKLAFEKRVLEETVGAAAAAFCYHNPGPGRQPVEDELFAGMVNADSRYLRERFGFCSDSNGYWRRRVLREVLESGADERLHVLTHPEWWVPDAMAPRERILRAIRGRAERQEKRYDALLEAMGRSNVR